MLTGRRAVVTGAGSGIGYAIAHALMSNGAHVTVLDVRGTEKAARTLDAAPIECDLADLDAVSALGLDTDILVNCAGYQRVAPVEEFPIEEFSRMLTVMVEAPFRLTRQVLPGMYRRNWGRVVNITSVHGLRASPLKSGYVTAKHALEGFSKVVALEGAAHGVTSNCVSPGYVRTPLVENQVDDLARLHGLPAERVLSEVMLTSPAVKRLIEPDEVAEAVVFLCGPASASISGSSLTIDGGWTAH